MRASVSMPRSPPAPPAEARSGAAASRPGRSPCSDRRCAVDHLDRHRAAVRLHSRPNRSGGCCACRRASSRAWPAGNSGLPHSWRSDHTARGSLRPDAVRPSAARWRPGARAASPWRRTGRSRRPGRVPTRRPTNRSGSRGAGRVRWRAWRRAPAGAKGSERGPDRAGGSAAGRRSRPIVRAKPAHGGDVAVGLGADDVEGIVEGGDGEAVLEQDAQAFDEVGGPLGEVGRVRFLTLPCSP